MADPSARSESTPASGLAGGTDVGPAAGKSKHEFRPDIEGLRAVAVILVLAYHARMPGFGGGFVGVDVFFVISGFLITGLIVRELRATGGISLSAFYARRARRLLPAALFVILVTVVLSAFLMPPVRLPDIAQDAAASSVYVGNILFALQATDYLQAERDPSPLLHYWSLGVEEQFYLVWPALLLIASRLWGSTAARLGVLVVVIGVLSFVTSLVLTSANEPLAFFLLPTRAWELALGAILSLVAFSRLPSPVALLAGVAGLALIAWAGIAVDTSTPFPGTAALAPTLGAALVIAAGGTRSATLPSRLLATAPFRWVGRISYSLYLWHWPLLIIPAAVAGGQLPFAARLALAALTFPIAAASQRWIEDPIRKGGIVGLRPAPSLVAAGALSLSVALVSLGIGSVLSPGRRTTEADRQAAITSFVLPTGRSSGSPSSPPSGGTGPTPAATPTTPVTPPGTVPPDIVPSLAEAHDDVPRLYADGCMVGNTVTELRGCAYGPVDARATVVLFGDSHVAQWFPAVDRIASQKEWRIEVMTKGTCPAADLTMWNRPLKRPYHECDTWRQAAFDRIASIRPDVVIISAAHVVPFAVDGKRVPADRRPELWDAGLARALRTLRESVTHVVVIGDTPHPGGDPAACLSLHPDDVLACAVPRAESIAERRLDGERQVAAREGATFIDPTDWVCPTEPCPPVIGRLLVYEDGGHITATFATALAPYLDRALPDP